MKHQDTAGSPLNSVEFRKCTVDSCWVIVLRTRFNMIIEKTTEEILKNEVLKLVKTSFRRY